MISRMRINDEDDDTHDNDYRARNRGDAEEHECYPDNAINKIAHGHRKGLQPLGFRNSDGLCHTSGGAGNGNYGDDDAKPKKTIGA